MKKVICLQLVLGLFFMTSIFAQEVETPGDYMKEMGTKIGRGLENVVTSPAEIPCTMHDEMQEGNKAAGFFTGFGKGTVFFLRRVLVGVTEIGTFMIPMERTIPRVCSDEPLPATAY